MLASYPRHGCVEEKQTHLLRPRESQMKNNVKDTKYKHDICTFMCL